MLTEDIQPAGQHIQPEASLSSETRISGRDASTVMNIHTVRWAVGLTLALTLMLGCADRAFAATSQCNGCFAFIDANGNVGRSRGLASAAKLGDGRYEVVFTELVTKCAFTAPI